MKKNMGIMERTARMLVAAIIITLYFTNVISGTLAIILLALSAVFLLTSIIGVCPLYLPFGFSTAHKEDKK